MPEDPKLIAGSLRNLAGLLQKKGDYEQAEPLYRQAWEMRKKTLGNDHPCTIHIRNGLADLLKAKGEYGLADALLENR